MDDHLYIHLDIISVNNLTFSSFFVIFHECIADKIYPSCLNHIDIFCVSFYGDIEISKYTMFGIMSGGHIFSQPICDEPSKSCVLNSKMSVSKDKNFNMWLSPLMV